MAVPQQQGAGGAAAGPVACQLTLAAAAARPGDTVTALLQVSCSQPEAVELQEVEIEFTGVERVDTSWVAPTYRRTTPAINADKRKVQRFVVQSKLQAATQGTFSDLTLRRFVVRFTLPSWLPPTFHGTAARYVYYLRATVKHHPANAVAEGSTAAAAAAAAAAATSSSAARVPLHIWPARPQQLESAALERSLSTLGDGGAAAAASPEGDGSLLSPPIGSDGMPIKCWEIGPGTAVEDAVAHIIRLAAQPPQPNRPQSPGRLRTSSAGGGAPGGGGSSAGGASDSRGEISHEEQPEEVEMEASPGVAAAAAGQQQQEQGGVGSSSASSPRSLPSARRSSLSRPLPAQEGIGPTPRSPSQLLPDSGSILRSYALRIGEQPLVRVSLHPPLEGSLQPGSTLAGTLDFAHPAAAGGGTPGPRCMQVLILLETEEVVEQPWRRHAPGGGAGGGGGGGGIRRVHDEHLELTPDTSCTHFLFTIPPDASASFTTPLLHLRWLLRFQFTAAVPPEGAAGDEWSPRQGRLEQLTWALPVSVQPPAA